MFPSGATRFRLIIIILLIFLMWQILRLFPDYSPFTSELTMVVNPPGTPVLVSVFYEALCPDSKYFVIKQLLPTFEKAPKLIDYQLVPYGKATTTEYPNGTLKFECQHGHIECKANTIHACVISDIPDVVTQLDLISCMIKDNMLPEEALRTCAKQYDVSSDSILECSVTSKGALLLKKYGEATHALRPKISFIPTVLLDGSRENQAAILKNLLQEVCNIEKGRGGIVPPACE